MSAYERKLTSSLLIQSLSCINCQWQRESKRDGREEANLRSDQYRQLERGSTEKTLMHLLLYFPSPEINNAFRELIFNKIHSGVTTLDCIGRITADTGSPFTIPFSSFILS